MKTLFAIILLIVFGAVASFLTAIFLNIAGLPGALLAGKPGKPSKKRFKFAAAVAALGQAYVYFAYVAFIVNWTMRAARREDLTLGFMMWPFAFSAVLWLIWINYIRGSVEAKEVMRETGFANVQVEGLQYVFLSTPFAFLLFAFLPVVMNFGWGWVPYVNRP